MFDKAQSNKFMISDLVRVAKRDNNSIRPYLYVNPKQGKHIPVEPGEAFELYKTLAERVESRYPKDRILVIGFAETATAIGAGLSLYCKSARYCTQTTREEYPGAKYLYFTESHSHAAKQSLIVNGYDDILKNVDRIVFAEDEVTTGSTIQKLINCILDRFPKYNTAFSIASILNSMRDERIKEFEDSGIECIWIARMEYEYQRDAIDRYGYRPGGNLRGQGEAAGEAIQLDSWCNLRFVQEKRNYFGKCSRFALDTLDRLKLKEEYKDVLVLGTEEFMMPPLFIAKAMGDRYPDKEVKFHATTRSPILVSKDLGYPLFNRYEVESLYEKDRTTYVYNLAKYDYVVIVTDSQAYNARGAADLEESLRKEGSRNIEIVSWSD